MVRPPLRMAGKSLAEGGSVLQDGTGENAGRQRCRRAIAPSLGDPFCGLQQKEA